MVFWHAPRLARQTLIRHFRRFDTRCIPASELLASYIVFKIFTFPLIYLSSVCTSFLLFPFFQVPLSHLHNTIYQEYGSGRLQV